MEASVDVFSSYAYGKLDADSIQYLTHVDLCAKAKQEAISDLTANPDRDVIP